MRGETEFLVDRDKHRIVKRDGLWKLYCPVRGTGPASLIVTGRFEYIVEALNWPCDETVGAVRRSHHFPL